MTLTGILKNILLVIISVAIWATPITLLQSMGYAVALAGLVYYSLGYDQLAKGYHAATAWAHNVWNDQPTQGPSRSVRRGIAVTIIALFSTFILLATFKGSDITQAGLDMMTSKSGAGAS